VTLAAAAAGKTRTPRSEASGGRAATPGVQLALRDRLLASARFQRWAADFPLTRPVARRRARALFDLCAGFVYSQVLQAWIQLGVCEILLEGPQPLDGLADRLSLPRAAAACLMEAAAALRLARRARDGRFALGSLGAALLGNPGVAAMIRHHSLLYHDLHDPVALLRGQAGPTGLRRLWPYADCDRPTDLGPEQIEQYSDLMAASLPLVAADVLAAYRFDRHRSLLDLGGGDGSFLSEVADAAPSIQLMLFDLPAVAQRAARRLAGSKLAGRVSVFGGDMRVDALPQGADVISLVRVIHDHGDAEALAILGAARRALPPGGTLLLAEPMAQTGGAEQVGAYFSVYLLSMGSGRPRSAAALSDLLRAAGYTRVRTLRTRRPMLVRVLLGEA
jgi:demethylspheroidene O-methyltransferase